jgi:hypothetical protein
LAPLVPCRRLRLLPSAVPQGIARTRVSPALAVVQPTASIDSGCGPYQPTTQPTCCFRRGVRPTSCEHPHHSATAHAGPRRCASRDGAYHLARASPGHGPCVQWASSYLSLICGGVCALWLQPNGSVPTVESKVCVRLLSVPSSARTNACLRRLPRVDADVCTCPLTLETLRFVPSSVVVPCLIDDPGAGRAARGGPCSVHTVCGAGRWDRSRARNA